MAYSRYSRTSDWYIFAKVALGEEEAVLAVWHKDFRKGAPEFGLSEVRIMLELSDFRGYQGLVRRRCLCSGQRLSNLSQMKNLNQRQMISESIAASAMKSWRVPPATSS